MMEPTAGATERRRRADTRQATHQRRLHSRTRRRPPLSMCRCVGSDLLRGLLGLERVDGLSLLELRLRNDDRRLLGDRGDLLRRSGLGSSLARHAGRQPTTGQMGGHSSAAGRSLVGRTSSLCPSPLVVRASARVDPSPAAATHRRRPALTWLLSVRTPDTHRDKTMRRPPPPLRASR